LQDGGLLSANDDLSIGRFGGSTGFVYVVGGSLLNTNNEVWAGREGRGQLFVSNGLLQARGLYVGVASSNTSFGSVILAGGVTALNSNLLVGNSAFTNASVLMTGGGLWVTNAGHNARLEVISGTMTVTGGTITTDEIILTNGTGKLLLHGGQMRSRQTTVNNGTPFTIGDGVTPTTFVLEGGVHSFADGLVISPNATVTGCGTIVGGIVNHGTLAVTNCGPPAGPFLTLHPLAGSEMVFSFPSATGLVYTVEFKDTLDDPLWTPLPPLAGDGSVMSVTNFVTGSPARFFRLRVE
jgi:T5SS/PEP-CTERM-associated repeat protein